MQSATRDISLYAFFLSQTVLLSDVWLFLMSNLSVLEMPVSSISMWCFPTDRENVAGVISKGIQSTKQYLISVKF